MNDKSFCGPYAVLMTPFCAAAVDHLGYAAQVRRLLGSKITGFVVNGSTGEFVHLSLKEQVLTADVAAEQNNGKKQLVVSACTSNAEDTLTLCRHGLSVGARAALVCPPIYFRHTKKERENYFRTIADRSPIPVLLYNIPFFTQEIELDMAFRLMRHENVAGIKDSSANMKRLAHLAQVSKESEFSVLTGTDDILFPALAAGCSGSMTAFATIYPQDVCAIYESFFAKDWEGAARAQEKLLPRLRKADSLTFPKGYKLEMEKVSGIAFNDKEVL